MAINNYYEQPEMWQNYDAGNAIQQKIAYIREKIPYDVSTILDVGCGNGKITNQLLDKWQVTGLDISAAALEHVLTPHVQASATHIPFPDQSFDLVISSEMLEHLDDETLTQALQEMQRVSKKYLLLSVPNDELLPKNHLFCPQCQTVFHSWQHLQSFDQARFAALLSPRFYLKSYQVLGEREQRWIPALLHLKQKIGRQWFAPTGISVCPNCGNKDFPNPHSNLLTKICNGMNRLLAGKKPYWQIGLFVQSTNHLQSR
jgi:ubiquinone/menaquinone biosynthesis C-methylase UbiE